MKRRFPGHPAPLRHFSRFVPGTRRLRPASIGEYPNFGTLYPLFDLQYGRLV